MKIMRWIILLVGLLLATVGSSAQVPDGGYIQINNGHIVTNPGQPFHLVVQFGNRGQETLEGIYVRCGIRPVIGDVTHIQSGPFTWMSVFDRENVTSILFARNRGAEAPNEYIELRPGQNHNVAIRVHTFAESGTEGEIFCSLGATPYGNWRTQVTVRVQ